MAKNKRSKVEQKLSANKRSENQKLLAQMNAAYQDEPLPEELEILRLMLHSHRRLVQKYSEYHSE
jgi:hypothetical protein